MITMKARSLLNRARRGCPTDSDAFPALTEAVLRKRVEKDRAKLWARFCETLEALAAAANHEFRADRTEAYKTPWYSKNFSEGRELAFGTSDLTKLSGALMELFHELEG